MIRFSLEGAPMSRVPAKMEIREHLFYRIKSAFIHPSLTGTTRLTDPRVPDAVAPAQAKLQKLYLPNCSIGNDIVKMSCTGLYYAVR